MKLLHTQVVPGRQSAPRNAPKCPPLMPPMLALPGVARARQPADYAFEYKWTSCRADCRGDGQKLLAPEFATNLRHQRPLSDFGLWARYRIASSPLDGDVICAVRARAAKLFALAAGNAHSGDMTAVRR